MASLFNFFNPVKRTQLCMPAVLSNTGPLRHLSMAWFQNSEEKKIQKGKLAKSHLPREVTGKMPLPRQHGRENHMGKNQELYIWRLTFSLSVWHRRSVSASCLFSSTSRPSSCLNCCLSSFSSPSNNAPSKSICQEGNHVSRT